MDWTKFVVMGSYDGLDLVYHCSVTSFLEHLRNYDGLDAYAHFGGSFDFLFILDAILKGGTGWTVQTMIPRGSGILSIDLIGPEKQSIILRDSSALLPFGLKKLTESFGVSSIKKDWDHSKTTGDTPELREYLKHDLLGLYQVIEKFRAWPINRRAGSSYTIAGQAMRVLRTHLKVPIKSLTACLDQELRGAYFGGRTEIFKLAYRSRRSPLYCYDVNSLYPTVMRDNDFPGEYSHEVYGTLDRSSKFGFYHAEVEVPQMRVPPLGVVREGKYIFPVGRFKGYWTQAEITYAESLGCRFRFHRGLVFRSSGPLFRDYIAELYQIRQSSPASGVDSTICKLLMNASYGRFGINLEREQIVIDNGEPGLKPLRELKVGSKTFQLATKQVELEGFSHVGIAAYVTAYARIYMHRLYMQAPEALYYTDTDSMYTTHVYPTGSGLGELKQEDMVFDACFLLPKTYMAGAKIKMKGFDSKKIRHFTMQDFYACLEGDLKKLRIVNPPKFAKLRTALKEGAIVTKTKEQSRQIRSQYDKRIIEKDFNTRAIELSEWG